MLKDAFILLLILLGVTLFLRINRTHLQEIMQFLEGIAHASLQELRFRGGRAAKANIILSVLLTVLLVFMVLHGLLNELRALLGGEHDQATTKYLYLLFALVLLFFFVSICFIFSQDRFFRKMKS